MGLFVQGKPGDFVQDPNFYIASLASDFGVERMIYVGLYQDAENKFMCDVLLDAADYSSYRRWLDAGNAVYATSKLPWWVQVSEYEGEWMYWEDGSMNARHRAAVEWAKKQPAFLAYVVSEKWRTK